MRAMNKVIGWLGVMLFAHGALAAEGGVSFSRNRLVYPAGERAISLTVVNHGSSPYLVQAVVSGDPGKKTSAPFMVTPPLFRLEGNGESVMRIVGVGADLPQDRESVFYFSGRVIPGTPGGEAVKDKGGNAASLSISMRTVLKLFYRPKGLTMSPQAAPALMQFLRTSKGVLVKNPTPYYQSFAQLTFDGKEQNLDSAPSMVAPFGELQFHADGPVREIGWRVMNDYGGSTDLKKQPVGG